jgi:hypothetical protein
VPVKFVDKNNPPIDVFLVNYLKIYPKTLLPLEGKQMYEEILDQMQELLKDEIKNFEGDFGKLEQAVMEMMMSLGKGLLQRLVDSHANGYQHSSTPCQCNSSMKFVQHRPRDIHTLFGWNMQKLKAPYHHFAGTK